jgi:DNA-binding IclR family transcriptional regulator
VASWSFLTNHARVLLCNAHDPGARLRDIAASVDITECSAHGIVTDLTEAGYVVKQKDGREAGAGNESACSLAPACP